MNAKSDGINNVIKTLDFIFYPCYLLFNDYNVRIRENVMIDKHHNHNKPKNPL